MAQALQHDDYTIQEVRELIPHLTPAELAELDQLITAGIPLWMPLPGPQTDAYLCIADILGFGGAAGGGKTDLILGKALNQHLRTAVFRQNGTEHTAFSDRAEELLGVGNRFDRWGIMRLTHEGRRRQIELGSMPNLGDEKKYRGRPHDLKVFDEVAEMVELQVRFVMGWTRTVVKGQRCQVLMTFNPPTTAEGRWVVRFFAPWLDPKHPNPAMPGELRYFATIEGEDIEVASREPFMHKGELVQPLSRTFIPSRISDNPYLMGTGYMATLQSLPEPLRSQMLYGDFQAGVQDDPWQVIPTSWVDKAQARWKPKEVKGKMVSMGVDVARGGKDNTIIARRHEGMWFDEPLAFPGKETHDGSITAGLVIANRRNRSPVHVDLIGWGSEVYAYLKQNKIQVIGLNGAEGTTGVTEEGSLRFANRRSELYWRMREALNPNADNGIALPPDPRLAADLTTPIWSFKSGIIKVESKEEVIKRVGRSTDWGDAYLDALIDTLPEEEAERILNTNRGEYDPYKSLDTRGR